MSSKEPEEIGMSQDFLKQFLIKKDSGRLERERERERVRERETTVITLICQKKMAFNMVTNF